MIQRLIAMLLLSVPVMAPGMANACPSASPTVLFHSCWGEAEASSLLLPEDGPVPARVGEGIVVTGGYTGKDLRSEKLPNPVGMFVHNGAIVNPTVARMDGVAILSPDGTLSIEHREAVRFGGTHYDLTDVAARRAFQAAASDNRASVFQSHLLIVNGRLDIRPREDAPLAVRRLLFTDAHGFGIFQTTDPVTLHASAVEVEGALSPEMALNLDMGSFDYCFLIRDGVERNCGVLARANTQKLSNLLVLSLKPRS